MLSSWVCLNYISECYWTLAYLTTDRHLVALIFFCAYSHLITRSLVCWKRCSGSETGTMPRVLWTRCLPSMPLLTRPSRWHSASLCTWLWSLFTEGADFMFHLLHTMCSQSQKNAQVHLILQLVWIFFPQFYVYKPTRTWDMENWFGKKYEIIHKLWYAPLYFLGLVFLKGQEDV